MYKEGCLENLRVLLIDEMAMYAEKVHWHPWHRDNFP